MSSMIYTAEKQIVKALPKTIRGAASADLKAAIQDHLAVTKTQVTRLEEVFGHLQEKPRAKHCKGMEGLLQEGAECFDLLGRLTYSKLPTGSTTMLLRAILNRMRMNLRSGMSLRRRMNLRMRMNPRRRSPREFATRIGGKRSGVQLRESPVKTPHGALPPVEAVSEKYGNPRVLATLGDIRPVGMDAFRTFAGLTNIIARTPDSSADARIRIASRHLLVSARRRRVSRQNLAGQRGSTADSLSVSCASRLGGAIFHITHPQAAQLLPVRGRSVRTQIRRAGACFRDCLDERELLLIHGDAESGSVVRPHLAVSALQEFVQIRHRPFALVVFHQHLTWERHHCLHVANR